MNQINIQYYKTKYAEFILGTYDNKLCLLDFRYRRMRVSVDNRLKKGLNATFIEKDNQLLKETRKQLDEYFNMERKDFDIPLLMVGTDFQKKCLGCFIRSSLWFNFNLFKLSKADQ